jgi:hypothetical protein
MSKINNQGNTELHETTLGEYNDHDENPHEATTPVKFISKPQIKSQNETVSVPYLTKSQIYSQNLCSNQELNEED